MLANIENVRRVALVRLDRTGDLLLWLGAAEYYRQRFEGAEIDLYVRDSNVNIAVGLPHWDRVIPVHVQDESAVISSPSLRSTPTYDLAINLQYSRNYALDRFLASLPALRRVAVAVHGPAMNAHDYRIGNECYSDLLELNPCSLHEVNRNFEILTAITGIIAEPKLADLSGIVAAVPHGPLGRHVAIFPGGSWHKKSYPWPRLVTAARYLRERWGLTPVLCGGPDDRTVAANIRQNLPGNVVDLTGRLDLRQCLGLIASAELVIANDSMPAHAAACLARRSICFVGGGYNVQTPSGATVGRFLPYPATLVGSDRQITLEYSIPCAGCSYLCKYDTLARDTIPCINYIRLSALIEAIDKLLGR